MGTQIKERIEMQSVAIIAKEIPKGLWKLFKDMNKTPKTFKPEVLGYDNLIEILQRKRISTLYSFKEVGDTLAKQLFDHGITVIRLQSKKKKVDNKLSLEVIFIPLHEPKNRSTQIISYNWVKCHVISKSYVTPRPCVLHKAFLIFYFFVLVLYASPLLITSDLHDW